MDKPISSSERNHAEEASFKRSDELEQRIKIRTAELEKEILQRKQAQEELRINEERYRLGQELGHIGSWVYVPQTAEFWGSDEAKRIYGFDLEQSKFSTDEVEKCIPERERVHQALIDLIEKDKPYNLEFEIRPRNSRESKVISSVARVQRDERGEPLRVVGVLQDITDRKRAEAARLAHLTFLENLDRINRAIQGANDLDQMMHDTLETALSIFACDRTWLFYPCDPDAPTFRVPMEITRPEYPGAGILNADVPMPPDMALNLRETLDSAGPVTYAAGTERPINKVSAGQFGVQSMMMVALHPKSGKPWLFGLHQCSSPRVWTSEEQRLFQEIGRRLADTLSGLLSLRDLRKNEEQYRRLVDTANEGVWVFGEDLRTSYTNARMAAMLGYENGEIIGRTMTDFLFEEDMHDHRKRTENRHRGLSEHYERRYRHKNGRAVWALVSAVPIMDADRNFKGSFAMFTDITERRLAEQREHQLQEYLQMQIDRMPIGLIVWDKEFRVTSWNPAAAGIFGFTEEEALGKHPYDFIVPKEAQPAVDDIWARLIKGDMTAYSINENRTKDGRTILCDWTNTPLHGADSATTSVLSMVQDITARKNAEEALKRLNEELEQRVRDRTKELERRNYELEQMNKAFVGRELKMVELKERIKELEEPKSCAKDGHNA